MTQNGPVRTPRPEPAATGAAGASASGSGDTVPLAKEDPQTKFFCALGVFQSCLKGLDVKFIGVPDSSNPNSPANNPDYIKALSTCAAKSNIVQALKDQQTAQDNLTPAQIETQNKGYLKWRDCMIGRGWGIPEPKPDSKGRLFSFGAGGGSSVPNFTPPPGQDLLSSPDLYQCATESQNKVASARADEPYVEKQQSPRRDRGDGRGRRRRGGGYAVWGGSSTSSKKDLSSSTTYSAARCPTPSR